VGMDAGRNKGSATIDRVREEVTGEGPASHFFGVKLLDFGLVRMERDSTGQLRRGMVVGTPAYMAPEQAKGEMGDARSDLYSLGVVLFRLVTGHLPFKGNSTMELLTALATQTPPLLSAYKATVPRSLVELTDRLLSKDSAGRPRSAADVAEAITRIEEE